MLKQTDATLAAWLAKAIATGGPYDPAATFLGVATAIVDKGALTQQSDITEPTGAMATRLAVTSWGTPHKLNDGRWVVDAAPMTFQPADETEHAILVGFFLNSAATAGTLKCFNFFPSAIELIDHTRTLSIVMRLAIDPKGNYSAEVVYNG